MDKLSLDYQKQFDNNLIYDESVFDNIDVKAKLHEETKDNPLSSAASCLNVLGALVNEPEELKCFLNHFNLDIEQVFEFPSNCNIDGQIYKDRGYVIFEWIGPKESPINEKGGGRGHNRTSIDAFVIARIKGKITQLLIEWKFTEGKSRPLTLERFSGNKGLERLRRYSNVLVPLRGKEEFPFNFNEETGIGLYDFSVDHLYQLLRMTLLAKTTTPINIDKINVQDYRIVHLSHSMNIELEILHEKYLFASPGLKKYSGKRLYDVWNEILTSPEKERFRYGHWDDAMRNIANKPLREYLIARY
jgi:hypothetical protein